MVATRDISAPLSVGIIGAGDIVRAVHLPVLLALPEARVAWVADVDNDRAKAMAASYKVPSRALPQDLSQLPEVDIYLLAIPFGARQPYYEALRGRNCAIYAEKPFAVETSQHREVCSWYPEYGLASGLMMRSWGANVALRKMIETRLFGQLQTVRFGYGHPGMVTMGRYYLDRSRGGGGMLGELGIHGMDAALFVSGARAATVEKARVARDGDFEVHSEATLQLQTDTGPVTCELTVSALTDTIDGLEFEFDDAVVSYPLFGQGYALHGDTVDLVPVVRPKRGGEPFHLVPLSGVYYPNSRAQMFFEYWRLFISGIRKQETNETAAIRSLLTTEVIENVLKAGEPAGKVLS